MGAHLTAALCTDVKIEVSFGMLVVNFNINWLAMWLWGLKSLESNLICLISLPVTYTYWFSFYWRLWFFTNSWKNVELVKFSFFSQRTKKISERLAATHWSGSASVMDKDFLQNFEFCRNDEQGGSDLKIMQPALAGPNPYQPFNLQELQIQLQLQFLKKRLLL